MACVAIRKLEAPRPRGNQPEAPPDDPLAEWVAAHAEARGLGRYVCLLGVDGRPVVPCPIGEAGGCAWGVRSPEAFFCMWVYCNETYPDGASGHELARGMGMSRERVRQILDRAASKLMGRAIHLEEELDE